MDICEHRAGEAGVIERMPFFSKGQARYDTASGRLVNILTPSEKDAKKRWMKIIDQRIRKLPVVVHGNGRGLSMQKRVAALGAKTGIGDHAYQKAIREKAND